MPRARGLIPTSFRMTPEGRKLLIDLATYHGIPNSHALELIIREAARSRGLAPEGPAALLPAAG